MWDGIPVSMVPSPFGPHSAAVAKLLAAMVPQVADCDAEVLTEIDWIVDSSNVIRPDITVVLGRVPERHIVAPPALVIEVLSESSLQRDTLYKPKLCSQFGTQYAFVDPIAKSISATDFKICDHCEITLNTSTL